MTDFVVIKDHPQMLAYVDGLQKANAEALAFYPRQVFEREKERGRLFLGLLNGEPCGYIYVGSGRDGNLRCHQVCIQYDARRRLYGAMLVVAIEDHGIALGVNEVSLRCGADLGANDFWNSLGYTCIGTEKGGVRRNRTINLWRKQVSPALFDLVAVEPARHKTSAAFWAKHKQTGVITGFARGKALKDYRALLERTAEGVR